MYTIYLDFQISLEKALSPGCFIPTHKGLLSGKASRHQFESHQTFKTHPHNTQQVHNNVKSKFRLAYVGRKAQREKGHQRQVKEPFSHCPQSHTLSPSGFLRLRRLGRANSNEIPRAPPSPYREKQMMGQVFLAL